MTTLCGTRNFRRLGGFRLTTSWKVLNRLGSKSWSADRNTKMTCMEKFVLPEWDFSSKLPSNATELVEICEKNYRNECGTLKTYFLQNADDSFSNRFFTQILPTVWNIGSEVETLFPEKSIKRLLAGTTGDLRLSRAQVCCLLVHMFLGKTKADDGVKFWADLSPWVCHGEEFYAPNDPRLAYVNALAHYFDRYCKTSEKSKTEEFVTFRRAHLEQPLNWARDFEAELVSLDHVKILHSGRIGDRPGLEIEMDFANKNIGFGKTATQEEILFGCSPEMCVAPLIVPTLGDRDAAVIEGAWKVCDSTGYGLQLQTAPRLGTADPVQHRCVLCVDALDYSECMWESRSESSNEKALELQLKPENLDRELNKLFVGFSSCPKTMPIATGKWGCGAFGGHPVLKSLLQVLAATAAEKTLNFYLFGDEQLEIKLRKVLETVKGKSISETVRMIKRDMFVLV